MIPFERRPDFATHRLIDNWHMAKRPRRPARQRRISPGIALGAPAGSPNPRLSPWPGRGPKAGPNPQAAPGFVPWLGPSGKLDLDHALAHPRYWATSRSAVIPEQAARHVAQLWTIKVLWARLEVTMGRDDHCHLRSAQAIVRFWAPGLCLDPFLDQVRAAQHRL